MEGEYVQLFSAALHAFEGRGIEFEALARQTLADVIGGSSYEALMVMIGNEGVGDPEAFARRLMETLGDGAVAICNVIEAQAAEEVPSARSIPAVARFEASAQRTGLDVLGPPRKKATYLHDQRMRDEVEEYGRRLDDPD